MLSTYKNSIFWYRRDLRLRDNPGLDFCLKNSKNTLLVYIFSTEDLSCKEGAASRWWLHHSLNELSERIKSLGSKLYILKSNDTKQTLLDLAKEVKAELICWNRLYEPGIIKRDTEIKKELIKNGLACESFNGYTLIEPWEIKNSTSKPYQVFTPFWRSLSQKFKEKNPSVAPKKISKFETSINSIKLSSLNLLPKIPWDAKFYEYWKPGEINAQKLINHFIKHKIDKYKTDRDFLDRNGSSALSPHLHFGEISSNDIWFQCRESKLSVDSAEPFLRQLGWRDFASHLLFHFPHTEKEPLKKEFESFPWSKDKKLLKAWQSGKTGYPIIDAGMRELWISGSMHNRVRMIVGSFLVKNLMIHWREGANWFWDCLLDADLANNTLGWQWVSGCGADAAPYFRIFNPITQSQKFDEEGNYLRKWLPELKDLPNKWIHNPSEAPKNILNEANIILGKTYPKPIVDLKETREAALDAYYEIRNK